MNCPPPEFSDEPPIITHPPEAVPNNTDIIVSALTSLIFTLVGVGSCLWLCWNIKDCFIAEVTQSATANGSRRANSRTTRTNDVEMPSGSSQNDPTVPPIDGKEDKPPSYDSLFPKPNSTDS